MTGISRLEYNEESKLLFCLSTDREKKKSCIINYQLENFAVQNNFTSSVFVPKSQFRNPVANDLCIISSNSAIVGIGHELGLVKSGAANQTLMLSSKSAIIC